MGKKEITVTIKDKGGKVLLEYSELIEISRGAMENMTWIKKGVWTIKELLNINISQKLDRAMEEGRREYARELLDDYYQPDSDSIEIDVSEIRSELSKLTTK